MKIKSGTEELIAKYLFGDITEHEKNNLTIGSRPLHNTKSFSIVYEQAHRFVSVTRHIHRLTHTRHGNISKRNITKYQSHQFS